MNHKMNYMNKWNLLDKLIYKIEILLSQLFHYIKENKEMPDPEEMILAATQHLQEENDKLKEYRVPETVIFCNEKYQCPKCKKVIYTELIEHYKVKHCPECGKRFFKFNKSEKLTKRISVEANVSELL